MPWILLLLAGTLIAGMLFSSKAEGSVTPEIDSKTPRGIRQNNPTNIKGKGWKGQTGSDSYGHAIFDTMVNGLRAAYLDISTGFVRDHEDTVDAIIEEWAGAEAPSISAYKSFVSRALGVSNFQKLTYSSHATALVRAISAFENAPYDVRNLPYDEARKAANKG